MPKFLYLLLFLSVGCLCGGASASDSALFMENDSFLVSDDFVPVPTEMKTGETPNQTVDGLSAKANDWNEPSQHSEMRYIYAIRQWLNSLATHEQNIARKILREAHPRMRALRIAIREKKSQLAAISFDKHTRPETLPKLGQELQALRSALRNELKHVDRRLREEAGIPMGPLGGDGFWLAPPTATPYIDQVPPKNIPSRPDEEKGFSLRNTFNVLSTSIKAAE